MRTDKGELRAGRPKYRDAVRAIQAYRATRGPHLTQEQRETLDEVTRRIRRLDEQVGRLVNLNNRYLETEAPMTTFDPSTDTVTFRVGDVQQSLKLNRADPNVPITMEEIGVGGAYRPTDESGSMLHDDRLEFEGLLEDYYQSAHRVLKLVRTLPGLESFKCREITIVRNKLVEHPPEGEAYSFGFGHSGPTVRPFHRPGRQWIDAGLVPNTQAFIDALATRFRESADAA
jgi:hypothetical protein